MGFFEYYNIRKKLMNIVLLKEELTKYYNCNIFLEL